MVRRTPRLPNTLGHILLSKSEMPNQANQAEYNEVVY